MNCKKCGKEIVGDIQRYCNDCKRQLRGEVPVKPQESIEKEKNVDVKLVNEKISNKEVVQEMPVEESQSVQAPEEKVNKKEKKHRVFSFGYILLVLFIIIVTFLVSCMAGFAMGPILPL